MAEGSISSHNVREYQGRITKFMLLSCIVASSCGLMFGYELGISGGVTSMNVFLEKFFPSMTDILFGIGFGFIAQATRMYLSEIAPPKTRNHDHNFPIDDQHQNLLGISNELLYKQD
ncbi:hypothetical protein AAC387_Pa01g0165 [Persea americana]